jgi:hypothetical protein
MYKHAKSPKAPESSLHFGARYITVEFRRRNQKGNIRLTRYPRYFIDLSDAKKHWKKVEKKAGLEGER